MITYYELALSGVLRYMFSGNIVPLEIEEAVVVLRKNLHTLIPWQTLIARKPALWSIRVQSIDRTWSTIEPKHTITFINTTWQEETITFSLICDLERWAFPITEITRKDRTYRSVPLHGDVRNHLHHQHTFYEAEYVSPLVDAWMISWDDATALGLYHKVHDVPEMIKWDKHVNDKAWHDAHEESSLIRQILIAANVWYTQQEIDFVANSFLVFEQPDNYFKWGERLNYILDALRAYKTATTFYHQHEYLVGGILQNQLEYFINSKKTVTITPLKWKQNTLPFAYLPSSQIFLEKYKDQIQEVLASWSYTNILLIWDAIVSQYKL